MLWPSALLTGMVTNDENYVPLLLVIVLLLQVTENSTLTCFKKKCGKWIISHKRDPGTEHLQAWLSQWLCNVTRARGTSFFLLSSSGPWHYASWVPPRLQGGHDYSRHHVPLSQHPVEEEEPMLAFCSSDQGNISKNPTSRPTLTSHWKDWVIPKPIMDEGHRIAVIKLIGSAPELGYKKVNIWTNQGSDSKE